MEEVFAYLKDVLGVKYLPRPSAEAGAVIFAPTKIGTDTVATTPIPLSEPSPIPLDSRPLPLAPVLNTLGELEGHLKGCTRCKLHKQRKNVVYGYGSEKAEIMFVGEGPGEQEDIQGLPFVGPAGQLLTKMIGAMGLTREKVYIANVVKCRPPMNRNPEADEIHECSPFLKMQIKMVNPKLIVALGTFAAQTLLQTDERISRLRGRIHNFENRKVIATFHPSYLLRNPSEKKAAWEDLKLVMSTLGMAQPKGQ